MNANGPATRTSTDSYQPRRKGTILTTKPLSEVLTVANKGARFPQVHLMEPAPSGYLHLAAEVYRRPPFLPNSRRKRALIAECKRLCRQLEADPRVIGAAVFDAIVAPPGRGSS